MKLVWMLGSGVQVREDGCFPSDLLFLASKNETNPNGHCYVETSTLDGETNLKIRKAHNHTWNYITAERASRFTGEVQCEQPNHSLYTFTGNLIFEGSNIPILPSQLLLRGSTLKNTEYIVGVVIYTGHETKGMMNAMNAPLKRSTLERKLDKLVLALLPVYFMVCLVGGIFSGLFANRKDYYMGLDGDGDADVSRIDLKDTSLVFITTMRALMSLFSTIIPISLYVSIEVIKFSQYIMFINEDVNMYHEKTNTPALARTSNLNEELGQVQYIFTDKTGTLTRNKMEFFKCSINGIVYGTGITEIERVIANINGRKLEKVPKSSDVLGGDYFNFDDDRIMHGAWRNEPNPEMCKEFFRCLAICHTVHPKGENDSRNFTYQAASPDEAALVTAARNFGFFFFSRTPTTICVRESHVESMGAINEAKYEILNVLEFNSMRKRQSVVCQFQDGRIVLYCKGADTVIYERLVRDDGIKNDTKSHLEEFGSAGLRTLCLAYRNLSPSTYDLWNRRYKEAKSSLDDRGRKLDEVAELIEKNLRLIGCTAIEDKLQKEVPICIETLSRAGIKIWMLTGDKMETSINTAYACNLLNNDMKRFIISSETDNFITFEELNDPAEITKNFKSELKKCLLEAQQSLEIVPPASGNHCLVIDGKCLAYALREDLCPLLLDVSLKCTSVICCRVSPPQKAEVISMVKHQAKKITLSIGDGANDVDMIRAAHVGIGIIGREGTQAVLASDFAIAQFRFLTDLLLVHGRWAYIRISKVVMYTFYKNLMFTLTQILFTFNNGCSGQRFYDNWFQAGYNVVFTSFPVLALGLLDKDVSRKLSKKFPQLYMEGLKDAYFNWRIVAIWALFAVYQSLIVYYFVTLSGDGPQTSSGKMLGLWDISTMAYTCVIVIVNLRLLMFGNNITIWHHMSVWGSILLWIISSFTYSALGTKLPHKGNISYVMNLLTETPYFYLVILLVPVAGLAGDFLYIGVQRWYFPCDYQIIQEIPKDHQKDGQTSNLLPSLTRSNTLSSSFGSRSMERHTGFAFESPGEFIAPKPWCAAVSRSGEGRATKNLIKETISLAT